MVKQLLLFLIVFSSGILFSQSENFRFKKLLQSNPVTPVCFAIKNDGSKTLEYLHRSGTTIKYITKEWIYVNMSPEKIASAQKRGDIQQFYFEFAPPVALNDSTRFYQKVNEVHNGLGGLPHGYTGKNVIIGYVDQGADWNHPDFRDENNVPRILRYWDHTAPTTASSPAPYGYGQVCDSASIANGTCTLTESGTWHGSTVAGAGSGNGRANGQNKGMAPDSKIIIVETNFNLPNWTLTIADACDYIFKVADSLGMPAVINLSVGSYFGSHDGNDPASVLMENLLDEKTGRIIVCAAGNSGANGKYHVHGNANSDTTFVWLKNNPASTVAPNSIYFDLWADSANFRNIFFAFGADKPAPQYGFRGYSQFHNQVLSSTLPLKDTIFGLSGHKLAVVEMYGEMMQGTYHLEVLISNIDSLDYLYRFATTGHGEYDLWSGVWAGLNEFVTTVPDPILMPSIVHYNFPDTLQTIVSAWSCSEKVITVGNLRNRFKHIDNNGNVYFNGSNTPPGKLSDASSKGPSRHGVIKPDISAGGDVTLSVAPLFMRANPAYNSALAPGGWHARNGGTSMASPVVAGIAALYLEKCNTQNYADFKRDLTNNALNDNFTGPTPNYAYGYGKVNALNLLLHNGEIVHDSLFCDFPTPLNVIVGTTIDSVHWSNGYIGNPQMIHTEGTYSATIYYNGNCETELQTVIPNGNMPTTPTVSVNNLVLTASICPNYQWYHNDVLIPGATSQTYTITAGGTYVVGTTSPEGCIAYSWPVSSSLGITDLNLTDFTVFPNPTSKTIEIKGFTVGDIVHLTDIQGKNIQLNADTYSEIDMENLETGVYILIIQRDAHLNYIKIVRN